MLTRTIAAHIRRGGLIAYPTESCYGLGCDPDNRVAVQKLLKLKQRPANAKKPSTIRAWTDGKIIR